MTSGALESPSILSCQNLWKLFGTDSLTFLKAHDFDPPEEALTANGIITAVKKATIDVKEGEIFIIMGLSGSGKSTLVRCLSRLVEATAGKVVFGGQDLQALGEKDLMEIRRHRMGMVFQHFALLPHLTILGNVAFPLEIQGMERGKREVRALEMIDLVGLGGRENYYPRELSGGQQQRVGIARSLAVEPEIWFLDEPFSALDPLIRREMQDEFLRLQSVLRKTIVFITHDFDEAVRLADRIAIMKDGEIIQIGTAEELLLTPATDYVREFTKDIPRSKVLTARAVMDPIDSTASDLSVVLAQVPATSKLEDLADFLMQKNSEALVVDERKNPIGRLHKQVVMEALLKKDG
ncbi:MAG: glycine betaine/L-proline ABC transporter ATP-binding protein [Pseudomonadota bacterium]